VNEETGLYEELKDVTHYTLRECDESNFQGTEYEESFYKSYSNEIFYC